MISHYYTKQGEGAGMRMLPVIRTCDEIRIAKKDRPEPSEDAMKSAFELIKSREMTVKAAIEIYLKISWRRFATLCRDKYNFDYEQYLQRPKRGKNERPKYV